jgi:septum formation protein
MKPIYLASSSPRRIKILKDLDFNIIPVPVPIAEKKIPGEPEETVRTNAAAKIKKSLSAYPNEKIHWILGADTVVFHEGTILGKPKNREEAKHILFSLSEKKHTVTTGIALCRPDINEMEIRTANTDVYFSQLKQDEINWYLDTGEWEDAAGGYKIQAKGAFLVQKIEGSYSNVVGLPIETFYGMLREMSYGF